MAGVTGGWLAIPGWSRAHSVLVLLLLGLLLCGRFYWPWGSSSWAGSIRVDLLLLLLLCVVPWRERRVHYTIEGWLLYAFLLYCALVTLWLNDDGAVLRRVLVLAVFVHVIAVSGRQTGLLTVALSFSAIFGAGLALFSLLQQWVDGGYRLRAMYRIVDSGVPGLADFGNTIVAGLHFGFCWVVCLWALACSRRRAEQLFWALCLIPLSIYVYFTLARSAWLGCGLALLVGMLFYPVLRRLLWGGLALLLGLVLLDGRLFSRLMDKGLTRRDQVWEQVLDRMPGHWVLGHGGAADMPAMRLSNGQTVVNTHSVYLETLYLYGGVGLALFVAMLLALATRGLRRGRSSAEQALASMLLLSCMGVMFVDFNSLIHSPSLLWLWLWLPAGMLLKSGRTRPGAWW